MGCMEESLLGKVHPPAETIWKLQMRVPELGLRFACEHNMGCELPLQGTVSTRIVKVAKLRLDVRVGGGDDRSVHYWQKSCLWHLALGTSACRLPLGAAPLDGLQSSYGDVAHRN